MSTRNQIILAATLVIFSIGIVAVFTLGGESEPTAQETMEGHDHSAMVAGGDEAQPVSLDADAARRIGVTYATVTLGTLQQTVRSVGTVGYDETRLTTVSPKIEGWVDGTQL